MKNKSLRIHLIITFAIMAMIPILLLGSLQVRQIKAITEDYNQTQMQTTYRLADAVQTYIYYHRNAADTLATTISASSTPFRTKESLTSKLQSVKNNLPGFSRLMVADRNGKVTAVYPESEANKQQSIWGMNISSRDYAQTIMASHATTLSSLFRGPESGDQPTLAIATPVLNEQQQFDGFVVGLLDIKQIEALVTKYDYGTDAYAVVLDAAGRAIYHPVREITDSLTDLSKESAMPMANTVGQGSGKFNSHIYHQDELVTFKSIRDLGWTVWVSRSYKSVNAAFFDSLRTTFLLLILTLLLTVIVGNFLAKRLNNPIHALVGYTQKLADGAFSPPDIPISSRGVPTELHRLADHFSRMAEQVKGNQQALIELNEELESRVADRTRSLLKKNQELEIVNATLNAVLESMSDAIVLINVEQKVGYANRRMSELFSLHDHELLAMTETTLFDAIDGKLLDEHEVGSGSQPLRGRGQLSAKLKIRGNPDRDIFVMVTSFQVAGEEHDFGCGYVWRDITKEHEIDSLKNDLISLASHEFKTPITSIKGGVETLLRTDAEWEESFKQELLEGIHEDIGRIQELIDEWLDISKIESGAMRINRQPLLIRSAIHAAMHRLPKHSSFENVVFDLSLDEGLPTIYADKLRLEQVLVNLFNNAIRYNHSSQPRIGISASQDEAFVHILIQDNGIGISSDHVEHIFDRFYRVDVSSSRQTGGTGLGLAICKGIMEAHGGHIRVQSRLGSGSTFIISLPNMQWKDGYELEEA